MFRLLIFLLAVMSLQTAQAQSGKIYISVGKAKAKKSLLAMPLFKALGSNATSKSTVALQSEIYKTVKNDLTVVGLFKIMNPNAFVEDPDKTSLRPYPNDAKGFKFTNWSSIGAEFLIRSGVSVVGSEVKLESYLYYVPQAKLILGRNYSAPKSQARKLAHSFANDVVESLTGKKSMFNSRIVVTSNRAGNNYKEIYTMDWDGKNIKRQTRHKNLSISPAISKDGKKIAYTSWAYHPKAKTRNADLFIKDIESSSDAKLISYRKGINSGANFHHDGEHLYMTLTKTGNADIYKLNLNTKKTTPITRGPRGAMNVEPAISPDGKYLAFSSDRSGRPMIYVMNLATKSAKRVTFAGKYNSTPSWSPDGKKLAFAGYDKGHFDIFVMDKSGHNLVRLTSARKPNGKWADNEGPTFSPDGRFVMFTSNRTGRSQLYIVDIEGNNERRITYDRYNYEKPKWSGHLD
jgi:TolB protein